MQLTFDVAMIQCQNCGQGNAPESQFCRFCGTKFHARQPMPYAPQPPQPQPQSQPQPQQHGFDYQQPRPYAWKTDEFQTHAEGRKAAVNADFNAQPLVVQDPYQMTGGYRCPNCMSQFLPRIERRMSTSGWVVFAILLVAFFPLFWVGFLIKEDVYICPSCNARVK